MARGTFTCPHCGGQHPRSVATCPLGGEALTLAHKMGGTLLEGKYAVDEVIAEGGMGVVYRGRHRALGRDLAIKFLNPEVCSTSEMYARFVREARITASIDHAGIVEILDFGTTQGGIPFIVMEFLEGQDLAGRIFDAGRLDVGEAVGIAEQLIEALRATHASGVVHRDLKPDNVFLATQSGNTTIVKILDFGISRLLDDEEGVSRLTQGGRMYGTPHYLSPEQAGAGGEVDHRSDLYSVGVLLFEMLVGQPPFDSASHARLLVDIVTQPPPNPLMLRPDIPPALAGVILRALEKDPLDRYQSAVEMVRALRIARNTKPFRARRFRTRRQKPGTGSYRIIGPPQEVVVSKLPYKDLMGSVGISGPRGVDRVGSSAAARRPGLRSRPDAGRRPTPGHRADLTPNPDLGEPER